MTLPGNPWQAGLSLSRPNLPFCNSASQPSRNTTTKSAKSSGFTIQPSPTIVQLILRIHWPPAKPRGPSAFRHLPGPTRGSAALCASLPQPPCVPMLIASGAWRRRAVSGVPLPLKPRGSKTRVPLENKLRVEMKQAKYTNKGPGHSNDGKALKFVGVVAIRPKRPYLPWQTLKD